MGFKVSIILVTDDHSDRTFDLTYAHARLEACLEIYETDPTSAFSHVASLTLGRLVTNPRSACSHQQLLGRDS